MSDGTADTPARDDRRVFEEDWTVKFADVDPVGIAYSVDIVSAIHDVSDAFMAEVGYSWSALAIEHDAGFPLVEVHVEFESPVRADDVVTIEVRPSLGHRSALRVRRPPPGRVDGVRGLRAAGLRLHGRRFGVGSSRLVARGDGPLSGRRRMTSDDDSPEATADGAVSGGGGKPLFDETRSLGGSGLVT